MAVNNRIRYMKPMAGFAIAASVAVLALFGLRQVNLPPVPEVSGIAGVENSGRAITEPAIDELLDEPVDDELMEMHLRHAESSLAFGTNSRLRELVNYELEVEWRDGKYVEIEPDEHAVPEQETDAAAGMGEDSPGEQAGADSRREN